MSSRVIAEPWTPPYPARHPENFEALSVVDRGSEPPPKLNVYPWTAIPIPLNPSSPFVYSGVIEATSKSEANRKLVTRYYNEMPIEIIVEDAL